MSFENEQYAVADEIAAFFTKTPVSREACDSLAKELVGGDSVVPVAVQGACSYTVYAGHELSHVVQFRLQSLELKGETAALARRIFGALAPDVSFRRQLGDASMADAGREPLLVYTMTRIRGISRLDFVLAHGFPENSPTNKIRRKTLIQDVASFFALAWKTPQTVDTAYRDHMAATFETELHILLRALPDRFHPVLRATLRSLPDILALPMVLLHKDLGDCNIMVDEASCHLVGVIDWAEAEIGPFGTNLHSLQDLMSKLHLKNGWIRYEDYDDLVACFWETLDGAVGGLDEDTRKAIKAARVLGLLRSWAFTSRLANEPAPVPIRDDESGRYRMMILEGLLLDPATRFEGLEEWIGADGREDL
ncbi:hypothetical protein SPBR_05089 [Sporothrix brasiliensis 5110]|uniref:Aminoglycoside phosphotransferase domain-containing protein n=1 Tax=Sporothrix brasiliensis 5110 TaxID=1398154 RepID=A0A0C2IQH5_9PEZI|nr:uncharacterized protein SPBR_05089 [Sporothrix brasiliensis 5110]KIH87312.1 hypothetical protein SPBR_05089 [Sporothrix brasiliensis 5110]